MKPNHVQIINLEPLRLVSAWGFGKQPEDLAWQKMESWARPKGYLDDPARHRMFGFNNPNPSPGSPNYGYEFCLTVGPEVEPEGELRMKQLEGGKYAVMPFEDPGGDPNQTIPEAWQRLNAWVADNGYRHGGHQWLEEHNLNGRLLALFYPIAE